jgi:ankyrin repeat protein
MTPRLLVTMLGALLTGDLETIDRLVAAGADLNAPSGVNGWPPILHALHKGQHASVERLLEKGASVQGQAGRDVVLLRWLKSLSLFSNALTTSCGGSPAPWPLRGPFRRPRPHP